LLVVVVCVSTIALVLWVQTQPLIDAAKASAIAVEMLAGPDHTGWKADSAIVDYNGVRLRGNLPGFRDLPKCWGTTLPFGDGYCLPYPIWKVRVIGPSVNRQCSNSQVYVDGRKGRALEFFGGPEPC
jgi:hypothetical protein